MAIGSRARRVARDRPVAVSGGLSAVALALVFAAALRVVPPGLLPTAPDTVLSAIPHINSAISVVAFVVILTGWRAIRAGDVERHRRRMLTALGLFATFLVLYLYRVALLGPTEFPGTGAMATAYHAILGLHIVLAVICVPLLTYTVTLALSRPRSDIPSTRHRQVGRIAAPLWATSFALGVVVYAMLYVFV